MAPAAARVFHGKWNGAHKMDVDMRPEVVSELLASVETKWTQEALNVLSNATDEKVAYDAMEISCKKVSSAVVQGSDGDRLRVIEYMNTVCKEPNAQSNVQMCTAFGNSIQEFMIGDDVYNREQLDLSKFCHKFWTTHITPAAKVQKKKIDEEEKRILAEEQKREEEEIAARKKLAEEVAKKAAQDAEFKKQLAEAVAKNNTSVAKNSTPITVSPRFHTTESFGTAKTNQSAPAPKIHPSRSLTEAYATSIARALVKAQNSTVTTKTPQNTTFETSASNVTQTSENSSVQDTLVQNATVQENNSVKNNQSSAVDTSRNKTQVLTNTTKLMLKNTTVIKKEPENTTVVQGNLANKVIKHLKFILNRTKNFSAVNLNASL